MAIIYINQRAWLLEKEAPTKLQNAFFYQTTEQKPNYFTGVVEEVLVPIDLIVDKNEYLGFPRGNLEKILNYFKDSTMIDKRSVSPLGFHLELNPSVRKDERWRDQEILIQGLLEKGGGVIKAPPASGKSVVGVALTCRTQLKTLCLFERTDFLFQWMAEFRRHTNLNNLELKYKTELIGKFKGDRVWPITFATYQKLNTPKARAFFKKYKNYFGLIINDEVHHLAAPSYRRQIYLFNPLMLVGMTATPYRADGLEKIVFDTIGPLAIEGGSEQFNPLVYIHRTNIKVAGTKSHTDMLNWIYLINKLTRDKKRNQLIVHQIVNDVKAGRVVLAVSERTKHIFALKDMLSQYIPEDRIAIAYGATINREILYKEVDKEQYSVLLASKVIDEGVNISRLDTLHLLTPLGGRGGKLEQRIGRIRRPDPRKQRPLVRDYVDDGDRMFIMTSKSREKKYKTMHLEIKYLPLSNLIFGRTH